jgi:Peptidase family M28
MTRTEEEEPGEAGIDSLAELEAILDLGRRAPGSDAERRSSLHLQQRLAALGREADVESFSIYPAWPLGYALLAAASVVASVLAIDAAAAGSALALAAALLTFLDASLLLPTARRALGRRASQNVVSWGGSDGPGALVLVAHCDAPRGGIARRVRLPVGGVDLLFLAQLAVLACCVLRTIGIDGTALTIVQFIPTLGLIVAIALLADIALAGTRAGENDNASGDVLLLRLATRLGNRLEHFDVHVLFAGAQQAGGAGLRDFVKRHRDRLPRDRTVFVNLDAVGAGEVRYTRREGALLTARSHAQVVGLADQMVEDGFDAAALASRHASDGSAAAAAGFAAITITCSEQTTGRVEERALDRAEAFSTELVGRLDAELGPALSEPR